MPSAIVYQSEANTTVDLTFQRRGADLDLTLYTGQIVRVVYTPDQSQTHDGFGTSVKAGAVVTYTLHVNDFVHDEAYGVYYIQMRATLIATGVVYYSDHIPVTVVSTA